MGLVRTLCAAPPSLTTNVILIKAKYIIMEIKRAHVSINISEKYDICSRNFTLTYKQNSGGWYCFLG